MKATSALLLVGVGAGLLLLIGGSQSQSSTPDVPVPPPPPQEGDMQFIQARNYRPGRVAPISLLVIHDMEAPRTPKTALNVGTWFAGPSAPQASAHYGIDPAEIVQYVKDSDTAWAAPGANDQGLHFELAGYATDSADTWKADSELALAAGLVAEKAIQYGIPIQFVDAAGLLNGQSGITTHAEITKAWHKTTHTDPGVNFPIEDFIAMVQSAADSQQANA